MKKCKVLLLGLISGILNGLFGSGGGIVVVPMLKQLHLPTRKAHATSVAIILPLSAASTVAYLFNGVPFHGRELLWLIPFGLAGALLGAKFLRSINTRLLRKIFAVIILYSGIRMLFR